MTNKYKTKVTKRSAGGKVIKGELYENDILIATFAKPANAGWNYWEMTIRFGSERAKTRFESFCDSLSTSETLEALTE